MTHYPGYDALARWSTVDWDDATRALVRDRCENVPPFRFFDPDQAQLLDAVVDRIIPQPERQGRERVPIALRIDAKLYDDARDGYRYEGMPPQRDAWIRGLRGIEDTSRELYGRGFLDLDDTSKDRVLEQIQRGEPGAAVWQELPARRFFGDLLCATAIAMYYCDPTAWSEIGYSGPAAVRGHVRKWADGVDPWEPREGRDLPPAGEREIQPDAAIDARP